MMRCASCQSPAAAAARADAMGVRRPRALRDGIGERVAQREGGQAFGLALAAAHAAAGQGGFGALPVDGLADVLDCGVGGGVLMALIVVMSVLLECVIGEGSFLIPAPAGLG